MESTIYTMTFHQEICEPTHTSDAYLRIKSERGMPQHGLIKNTLEIDSINENARFLIRFFKTHMGKCKILIYNIERIPQTNQILRLKMKIYIRGDDGIMLDYGEYDYGYTSIENSSSLMNLVIFNNNPSAITHSEVGKHILLLLNYVNTYYII